MKSPLRKRIPRELRAEFGKYLVVLILMISTIGFVSGFLVADGSMLQAYNEGFEKYNIEDGNFRVKKELTSFQKKEITANEVTLYENFYIEQSVDNGSTMRFFKNRKDVNRVCLMKGKLPESSDEIAIDRMYADNNHISVGDVLISGGKKWKVTGFVALSDYSCLFQNNNDSMFDAVKFGVSVVTPEGFETLNQDKLQYSYSWQYDTSPKTEGQEKKIADKFMESLGKEVSLNSFVPRYQNQAINFTGNDMGSDKAMIIVLLYIVIVIMAFVFGITISNTIRREAGVIGTLRASGYTKKELIRHYMALPVIITLVGALIGNVLGYTVMKNVCASMYYGSYSLPTYVTIWNADAFWMTTLVPILIMLVVNCGVLCHKLRLSPLKFLRRDLSGRKQTKALPLSPKLGFFHRFRLRVIFQNMSNYAVLFVGIVFANLLLFFGLLLPSTLNHYQQEIKSNMLAKYQYMLDVPVSAVTGDDSENVLELLQYYMGTKTLNDDAEAFSAYSLNTLPSKYKTDEVLLYGIKKNSKYIDVDFDDSDEVYISGAYAEKFQLEPGDKITLKEKYEKKKYTFTVKGIYNYSGALCVFMPQKQLNDTFNLGNYYFSGYFSNSKITDINKKYIGSVVNLEALTKVSRQLTVSMGGMMNLINGFAIGIFIVLIYLLSKIIIEKNAQSISMAKILGYTNGEIGKLYIWSTTIVVVICLLLSLPIEKAIMGVVFREMMLSSVSGWIALWIDPKIYLKMFLIGIGTYAVVSLLEYRRIRRIPMDEALKNAE
ncbi:ABC transporter permease [Mogibacterium sp.]|uniref:ABC transporter permease n=1 Tax=Mogibacterium sp. TaxID=2049035 RepID=UPI00257EF007|nr:ABC transporter permease [Mogibacterium sp.]MBN2935003.1 ABC transporter permease [Mogibacterium sp.]